MRKRHSLTLKDDNVSDMFPSGTSQMQHRFPATATHYRRRTFLTLDIRGKTIEQIRAESVEVESEEVIPEVDRLHHIRTLSTWRKCKANTSLLCS